MTRMIANPKIGQTVQVWYRPGLRDICPYHGKTGIVRMVNRSRPKNHVIEIGADMVAVPCGNLRKVKL